MPIYEYTCRSCRKPFEQLHRTMTKQPRAKCPSCGSSDTARTLSVFAVATDGARSSQIPTCGHCGGAPGSCQAG